MNPPNPDDLKCAAAAALGFMSLGVQAIDRKFGEGHAAENPTLLGAFMLAAALDYHARDLASTAAQGARHDE